MLSRTINAIDELNIVRVCGRIFLLACLLMASAASLAQVKAQLAWSEAGSELNSIYLRDWDGEEWSAAELVYQTDNGLATPVLASMADGSLVLMWSEQQRRKSVLMWAKKAPKSDTWSAASVFSRLGLENVAPTMVRDPNGRLWVFWSAQQADYSDVFVTFEHAGNWSQAERVHAPNKVPDIRPQARISEAGEVLVNWSTYDYAERRYVEQQQTFNSSQVPPLASIDPQQELDFSQVNLPSTIDARFFGSLHAPSNRLIQTVRIEPR